MDNSFWKRLLAAERRTETYRRIIGDLVKLVRQLQQQLNDLRGQP